MISFRSSLRFMAAPRRLSRGVAGLTAAFIVFGSAHAAANVEHFSCHRLSGGNYASSITLTFDYAEKEVATAPHGWFDPMDGSVEVTDAKIGWGFMRGYAEFDRRTHVLDYDATAEYDYLDAIGHTSTEPRDDYKGRMQCAPAA